MFNGIRILLCSLWVLTLSCGAQSLLPGQEQIDKWLEPVSASNPCDASKGIEWGVIAGPFYNPEQGLGLGTAIVGIYRPDLNDSVSQNSTLSLNGYATLTGAFGVNFTNYAFFADDRWRFFVEGSLDNQTTYFWGQGFTAGDNDHQKQKYTSQGFSLRPMLYHQLVENTYLGVGWSLAMEHAADKDADAPRHIENTPEGASVFSSGASVSLSWDDRDFVPNPRSGQSADFRYIRYSSVTGSDTDFNEYSLHYSRYHLVTEGGVLAWEVNGDFTQGNVPWNRLPLLGSNERMRGYYEGRYRDKNVISGQLEYRQKLSWRHGIAGWIGAGTMASTFHELDNGRWLPSAGVGYRFEFKPLMNVRLDYGIGKGSSGFYFQVGEAF
ncbi:BamA/TamA family outer membrane protein [Enterobacter sp. Bisph1]|uniref:BamA/TamA family outer membrane protein n=1 Tax=Enterobacter sp. Bisph1 TaxID=1274399 RepID=UPI00057C31ED|nr:BamA/TamA family outer membrane protein [Enterobacter sp. Bisph1]